ncbi:MAG: DUF2214 family protein [Agarilytica sp.]
MAEVFVRYIHFLAFMTLASVTVVQYYLVSRELDSDTVRKLRVIDTVAGASAIIVFFAGVMLWSVVGKPASIYNQNWILHLKIALFVTAALISIIPTRYYRNFEAMGDPAISAPGSVKIAIRVQLSILGLLPLLAALMARGYGG